MKFNFATLLSSTAWKLLMFPFSLLYLAAVFIRNILFDSGVLPRNTLQVPVISIGNITAGGTGKTPMTAACASIALNMGLRPAVVSRGYGRKGTGIIVVTSSGPDKTSPRTTGDEPAMLARSLPDVPIVVGADRYTACMEACRRFSPDLIILDDAFQHRRINRDLNIVTLDAAKPFGNGSLLPAGTLREPPGSLRRADIAVLTRSGLQSDTASSVRAVQARARIPILLSRHEPGGWVRIPGWASEKAGRLRRLKIGAFCGIAQPESFFHSLRGLTGEMVFARVFGDHYWYTADDIRNLTDTARALGADAIVTTEKDAVRLDGMDIGFPLFALRIRLVFPDGDDLLRERIIKTVQ